MIPAAERYFALIEATLRDGLANYAGAVVADDERSFLMAWSLPAVADRFGFECSQALRASATSATLRPNDRSVRYVDGAGHSRPVYRAIAQRAFGRGSMPSEASNGQDQVGTIMSVWALASSLARSMSVPLMSSDEAGHQDMSGTLMLRNSAAVALKAVAKSQLPDGTFLARTDANSLEPQWYGELAILHALSCYASESGDQEIAAVVRRAAKYHAAETQPDHASTHPWAIAAFLDDPDTIPLADMMLHATGVQQPSTMDAVSLLLLADALDCGRRRATR
jgi:hypothetical protein